MNGSPAPRPALKKAADAHIHPAAPGQRPFLLRHAGQAPAAGEPQPDASIDADAASAAGQHKSQREGAKAKDGNGGRAADPITKVGTLSKPLAGNTSDSLRRPGRRAGGRTPKASGKKVEFSVKIPKSLRKEFRTALKAERKDADAVVASLLRSWLDG